MSIIDTCQIRLPNLVNTCFAAESFIKTLYRPSTTILFFGELGAGKTTFIQAFAQALGISERVTSPTYALEQRYPLPQGEFLHLDLYRLNSADAAALLDQTDDTPGIRCIEWPERLPIDVLERLRQQSIAINIIESNDERTLTCIFQDTALPTEADIAQWQTEFQLPSNVIKHCAVVAELTETFAQHLLMQGWILRPIALKRAAQAHDLFRFIDFRQQSAPEDFIADEGATEIWQSLRDTYAHMGHEAACSLFLQEQGFLELAQIVETHGPRTTPEERQKTEQKLLFYADKRVRHDEVVPLDDRFADFAIRYSNGALNEEQQQWYRETKQVERELFGDEGPPV